MTVQPELAFFVPGAPAPQGSKKHVGGGRMVEVSKRLKPWRAQVTAVARATVAGRGGFPKGLPLFCALTFYMPRGVTVKRLHPTVTPDLDKLVRAVNDGLTDAGVWADDSQVVSAVSRKFYSDNPGVTVVIREVGQ